MSREIYYSGRNSHIFQGHNIGPFCLQSTPALHHSYHTELPLYPLYPPQYDGARLLELHLKLSIASTLDLVSYVYLIWNRP